MALGKDGKIAVAIAIAAVVIAAAVGIGLLAANNNGNDTVITYRGDGGVTPEGKDTFTSSSGTVEECRFTKEKNSFKCWTEDYRTYAPGEKITGRHTLTAKWSNVTTLQISNVLIADTLPSLYVVDKTGLPKEVNMLQKSFELSDGGSTTISMGDGVTGWVWDSGKKAFTHVVTGGSEQYTWVYSLKCVSGGTLTPDTDRGHVSYSLLYSPGTDVNIEMDVYVEGNLREEGAGLSRPDAATGHAPPPFDP